MKSFASAGIACAFLSLWSPGASCVNSAEPKRSPEEIFAYLDSDADGKLTPAEFEGLSVAVALFRQFPALAGAQFKRFDTDKNGTLSLEEFRGFIARKPAAAERKEGISKGESPVGGRASELAPVPPTSPEGIAFFEKHIRPVLVESCYECHSASAESLKGGLRLDSREGVLAGGDGGPVVVPGDVSKSALVEAIRYKNKDTQMPPLKHGGKLPDGVILNFEKWIAMGAPDPREGVSVLGGVLGGVPGGKTPNLEKGRQHWAFQPVRKCAPPQVSAEGWPYADSDRFLLAAMEARGIAPVGDAERSALLRRVYFDLTGLPPSFEAVEAFSGDATPGAFAKVVDGLLASPAFGERWGRFWLDVARYADSSGRGSNVLYPHAWRYRDYVIAAFNADKPYDQFLKEQIAGDLLPWKNDLQRAEQTVATGFLAVGPKQLNEPDNLQFQLDLVDEQVDTLMQASMGMTVGCARCHDHKFDPISQKDYYALAGIFRSSETLYGTVGLITNQHPAGLLPLPASTPVVERPFVGVDRVKKEIARLESELKSLVGGAAGPFALPADPEKARKSFGVRSQLAVARNQLKEMSPDGKMLPFAMGVRDKAEPSDMPLYLRGDPAKPSALVARGFLEVAGSGRQIAGKGSGRLELAGWIASPENPLTARVMVNRVWHHLFGRGLVPSVDNFGSTGEAPSHPELLDFLAARFVENGWSVKSLVRELVISHAYQLGSTFDAKSHSKDPENALVWRMAPRRLDAEAARDAMLAVSGRLQMRPPLGSVPAKIGDRFAGFAAARASEEAASGMRSVYLTVLRDQTNDVLALFDFANPNAVTGSREETTTPAQALFLMNSSVVESMAGVWAKRLSEAEADPAARIRLAYRQAFGRDPTLGELAATESFFKQAAGAPADARTQAAPVATGAPVGEWALAAFCQALFASAEFRILN